MTKHWALVGAVVVAAATTTGGQERVQHSVPDGGPKVAVEVVQMPAAAKVRVPLETKVITGAPYSAEIVTESVETLADGNRIVHRTSGRVYRDAEGRVRREEDRGSGEAPVVSITDPVAKVSYSLDPYNKVAMKTQGIGGATFIYSTGETGNATVVMKSEVDPADLARKRQVEEHIVTADHATAGDVFDIRVEPSFKVTKDGPAWDEKVEKLPAKQIEGVLAEGTRTTRTIPAGAVGNERPIVMVTEEWRSPELQVLVATTTSDPRTGESTYRLTNIVRGDPGQSWFEVPTGYTVQDSGIIRKNVVIKHKDQ
jgi:hypothetical protein